MCRSIEEMLEKNSKEVTERNTLEFARQMIALGKNTIDDISKCTGLKVAEVKKLASEIRGKQ